MMRSGRWILALGMAGFLGATGMGDEARARKQLERALASHDTPEAWSARRAEIRRQFLIGAKLWPLPEHRPTPRVVVHGRREHEGYSVENIAIETLPGFYCTGNLYRPRGRTGPGPAILCPHGHFQPLGRFREEHQIRCVQFARMGATVFSYAMVGWQDSRQTTHDDPLALALQTWNSLRAVDYVAGLPGVDPSRIGVTGASGGGTQSIYLALIDDRIKAIAPMVILYPWTEEQGCNCEGGLPVMKGSDTNAIEVAASLAPRPQLIVSVGADHTRTFPEVGFPFIRAMYERAGAPGAASNLHLPDEDHDYGPSKRRAAYAFFAKHLGLEMREEDPSKITIEPPETMEVFNDRHPLPEGAIRGPEAVALAFASVFPAGAVRVSEAMGRPIAEYAFKPSTPADEDLVFTPEGFDKPGQPSWTHGAGNGLLRIVVRDDGTGKPTPCRINVVGPDGNYYQPHDGPLEKYSLTGQWPKPGAWGNRPEKAPIRYFGRFFYSTGEATVEVPAGTVRVEAAKGLEYEPWSETVVVAPGQVVPVNLALHRDESVRDLGYASGDPHVHIPRATAEDDRTIFDLMEAEDIRVATLLAYNEPAGPYHGRMDRMASPQPIGLGAASERSRGAYHIISGQEYRSSTYGHLNLFLLDDLVMKGHDHDANNWPLYGDVIRQAREAGGVAFYAHGGYAQAIYADVAQGNLDAVELLQFGVYRGIGLPDWYRFWNCGFRLPAVGACDYPACRKLGDDVTYVHTEAPLSAERWLRGAAQGSSFVTSGPLLLLEVDGHKPGDRIDKSGAGPHRASARVRVRCEVAPVTNLQLIVNGRVAREEIVRAERGRHRWIEFSQPVEIDRSAWIAARAFSLSRLGTPDAEAHTNPVSVILDGKAPFERDALDELVVRLDAQIAAHKKRDFPEKARVLAYFDRSRDILLKLREAGGTSADTHPSRLAADEPPRFDPGSRTHDEEQLRAYLKPVPPKPIEEVLNSFETAGGFQMQLVAREPLVVDPVAGAFDEDGNLYICEMRDYPYRPKEGEAPLGTVRLLRDTDGDGTFDESHVFADKLLWAAGVAPWKGGVFVAASPDIWYLKDTDGDHVADARRRVFTGFGTQNQQAMVNNLQWWLDHKIYGATAGNGGSIRPADRPDAPPIDVDGRDFRFDPESRRFETITGTVQFGNTFNDWGDRFVCSESRPLIQVVLPEDALARNPFLTVNRTTLDLAPAPVPIFRISPIERWRQIRSSRRIAAGERSPASAGASHHVVDAAAGVTIYRGGAYPPELRGDVFVSDPQNNLIHHRKLVPDGVTFKSTRAEEGAEFVRSSDTWFRPVNLIHAPDGTLYVLDLCREVLESIHIPDDVVKHLDLTSGRDKGRIYRLAPPGFRASAPPKLSDSSTRDLVVNLESPHAWRRDTAHRLIHERQDPAAVPLLKERLEFGSTPQSRIHALWSLEGLRALSDTDLIAALSDPSPFVREQALRVAGPRIGSESVFPVAWELAATTDDPRVRFQLALALGAAADDPTHAAVAMDRILRRSSGDPWIRAAVLASSSGFAADLLGEQLKEAPAPAPPPDAEIGVELATIVGARGRAEEVAKVLGWLIRADPSVSVPIVRGIGRGAKRAGRRLDRLVAPHSDAQRILAVAVTIAMERARDPAASTPARTEAIELLSCLSFDQSRELLTTLLEAGQPAPIQTAAVRALGDYPDEDAGTILLDRIRTFDTSARREAVEALLSREPWTLSLLRQAGLESAMLAMLEPSQRSGLLQHRDDAIRTLATRLLGAAGSRAQVVAAYRPVLALSGEPKRGLAIFRRECSACHRIGEVGQDVGPDLTSSSGRDGAALLDDILDPNRYVLPNFVQYQVADAEGRVINGLISAQSPTSITLRREEGRTETILRANIAEVINTGRSLMPEGLEARIGQPEMADLIAFLQSSRVEAPAIGRPLDIGTLPGLVEPDRTKAP
jgi:putative membrane-bound dehydrogenase-like protein